MSLYIKRYSLALLLLTNVKSLLASHHPFAYGAGNSSYSAATSANNSTNLFLSSTQQHSNEDYNQETEDTWISNVNDSQAIFQQSMHQNRPKTLAYPSTYCYPSTYSYPSAASQQSINQSTYQNSADMYSNMHQDYMVYQPVMASYYYMAHPDMPQATTFIPEACEKKHLNVSKHMQQVAKYSDSVLYPADYNKYSEQDRAKIIQFLSAAECDTPIWNAGQTITMLTIQNNEWKNLDACIEKGVMFSGCTDSFSQRDLIHRNATDLSYLCNKGTDRCHKLIHYIETAISRNPNAMYVKRGDGKDSLAVLLANDHLPDNHTLEILKIFEKHGYPIDESIKKMIPRRSGNKQETLKYITSKGTLTTSYGDFFQQNTNYSTNQQNTNYSTNQNPVYANTVFNQPYVHQKQNDIPDLLKVPEFHPQRYKESTPEQRMQALKKIRKNQLDRPIWHNGMTIGHFCLHANEIENFRIWLDKKPKCNAVTNNSAKSCQQHQQTILHYLCTKGINEVPDLIDLTEQVATIYPDAILKKNGVSAIPAEILIINPNIDDESSEKILKNFMKLIPNQEQKKLALDLLHRIKEHKKNKCKEYLESFANQETKKPKFPIDSNDLSNWQFTVSTHKQ